MKEKELIKTYLLKLYRKRLPEDQVTFIAQQEQTNNPLFLHALLEELRQFGIHEQLPDRIMHYLSARGPKELYTLILERLEEDYETERPNLVGESLSLLWASRRGLSEPELLGIMNLTRLIWSPLFLALQDLPGLPFRGLSDSSMIF